MAGRLLAVDGTGGGDGVVHAGHRVLDADLDGDTVLHAGLEAAVFIQFSAPGHLGDFRLVAFQADFTGGGGFFACHGGVDGHGSAGIAGERRLLAVRGQHEGESVINGKDLFVAADKDMVAVGDVPSVELEVLIVIHVKDGVLTVPDLQIQLEAVGFVGDGGAAVTHVAEPVQRLHLNVVSRGGPDFIGSGEFFAQFGDGHFDGDAAELLGGGIGLRRSNGHQSGDHDQTQKQAGQFFPDFHCGSSS